MRDVAQARISKFQILFTKKGWSEDNSALFTAILGELANNCFDHNLGQWRDIPGCWLDCAMSAERVTGIVADRGQGILGSLKQVRPMLKNHQEALHLAFTEQLSGRAPENRGNGLKFVMKSLRQLPCAHFLFQSGDAKLAFEAMVDISALDRYITEKQPLLDGVYAEIIISRI